MKIYSHIVKQAPSLPLYRSPEQERILAELFVFADGSLSISEIAERTGTSLGGAHKEVERLQAAGLVRSSTVGRSRLVQADQASPVYRELRSILLKTRGPEKLLRDALADISGIDEAWIYGSWADPAERSPDDIDVLVLGEPDMGELYDAVATVEHAVGRPVNLTVRSGDEWRQASGGFEQSVRAKPRITLI
ncbi:MAG TPA: MarR family transcriptional regulator [Acidimicrobiia bacterium]|nr:MarR family transcriptional regulator [Acidimicrobiia bacterium]